MRKLREIKLHTRNLTKGIDTRVVSLCKILGVILKVDERKTSTNRLENK